MIDLRRLTGDFAAAPQIDPEDMAEIARLGFGHVVCNRPDSEVPASHAIAVMEKAAHAAGLGFTAIPVDQTGLTPEKMLALKAVLEQADKPVLGFCRSGTRSTNLWALAQAARGADPETIVAAAATGGYDISALRPALEQLSSGTR